MEEPKITAIRNGVKQEFTRKMWDLMGTDKYGWELLEKAVPQIPKEVAKAHTLTVADSEDRGILSFNKEPQTVAKIAEALSNKPAPGNTPGANKQSKRKKK